MYLLLLSTLVGFLSVHSGYITKCILKWCKRMSPKERGLYKQRSKLKEEQSTLSNVKDFVKFSKLQRKINQVEQELSELQSGRVSSNFLVSIGFTYGIKVIVAVVILFMTVYYRKQPVMVIDPKYDLYPFTGFISYPNNYENSVSVHFWIICCSSVAKLITFKY